MCRLILVCSLWTPGHSKLSEIWAVGGAGSKSNECSVAPRPLLFAPTPVLLSVGAWCCLKSAWARLSVVILGGFSAIPCSVRQESWLLTVMLRGALPSAVPPVCSALEAMSAVGESQHHPFCWSQVFRAVLCHTPRPSHTKGLGPWCYQACPHPGPLVPAGLESAA